MYKIIVIACTLLLFSCAPGKPHSKAIKETKACIDHFESLGKSVLASPKFSATMQDEKHELADKNHRLFTLNDSLSDSDCYYRGIRHYGKTIVMEIKLFKRREPEDALEGEGFMERHFLILGDIENFDSEALTWRSNEHFILEEKIGQQSKLFVTHSSIN